MHVRSAAIAAAIAIAIGIIAIAGPNADAASRKPTKPTPRKTVTRTTGRPCNGKTLPAEGEDRPARSFDIDGDGKLDLVVSNRDAVRIAFAKGPEVRLPIPYFSGSQQVFLHRFTPNPEVFVIRMFANSSGFFAAPAKFYRRRGCVVNELKLPGSSERFGNAGMKTGYITAGDDTLQCLDGGVSRFDWDNVWTPPSTNEIDLKRTEYSLNSDGWLDLRTPTVHEKLLTESKYSPPGTDCLSEAVEIGSSD